MDAPTAVVVAGGLSLATGVLASWITSRVAGRANRTNALLEWAKQLQASEQAARTAEQAARKEAGESRDRAERIREEAEEDVVQLRADLDDLGAKLRAAHLLVDRLTDTLTSVQTEVWRPQPDISALREFVGRPPNRLSGG